MGELKAKRFLDKKDLPGKHSEAAGCYGMYYTFLKHFDETDFDCVEVTIPRGSKTTTMATSFRQASKRHFNGKFTPTCRGGKLYIIKNTEA